MHLNRPRPFCLKFCFYRNRSRKTTSDKIINPHFCVKNRILFRAVVAATIPMIETRTGCHCLYILYYSDTRSFGITGTANSNNSRVNDLMYLNNDTLDIR